MELNILLILNSLVKLINRNRSGLKLVSICWLFFKKNKLINHSGPESLNLLPKINTFKLIGRNGLIRINKLIKDKRDLVDLIHHKCKDSLEWEVWVACPEWVEWADSQEWAEWEEWEAEMKMTKKSKEILMIWINLKKLNKKKNDRLCCI